METFKVGDLVKVKENISLGTYFTTCNFVEGMLKYRGRITRIKKIYPAIHYKELYVNYSLVDIENYVFDPEMLELIPEYSIISNNSPLIIKKPVVSSVSQLAVSNTQLIPKFKIGDKVRIKTNLEVGKLYEEHMFVSSMKDFKGNITIVKTILTNGYYLDGCNTWIFTDDMLELVEEPSIKLKDSETLKLFL